MRKKRRKVPTPIALLWTRGDQRRFTDAVEKLATLVGDLDTILAAAKRRKPGPKPREEQPGDAPGQQELPMP